MISCYTLRTSSYIKKKKHNKTKALMGMLVYLTLIYIRLLLKSGNAQYRMLHSRRVVLKLILENGEKSTSKSEFSRGIYVHTGVILQAPLSQMSYLMICRFLEGCLWLSAHQFPSLTHKCILPVYILILWKLTQKFNAPLKKRQILRCAIKGKC